MPMMTEEHPCFQLPPKHIKIWRFIDFTKYISLLDSKRLFFSRADLLGDPHEGSFPHANIRTLKNRYDPQKMPDHTLQGFLKIAKHERKHFYISCWYMGDFESNAMWNATETDKSVVIQSTYNQLCESLKENKRTHIFKHC